MAENIFSIYPEWFHYTDTSGLTGILRSQVLRATHFEYLDDEQEIRAFQSKFAEMLIPRIGGRQPKATATDIREFADFISTTVYKSWLGDSETARFAENYITSFSYAKTSKESQHGIPEQWRDYCPVGGCAIVFDSKRLDSLLKLEASKWRYDLFGGDIVYSNESERLEQEFGENVDIVLDKFCEWIVAPDDIRPLERTWGPLIYCACRYKRADSKGINEIRIAVVSIVKTAPANDFDGQPLKPNKPVQEFTRENKSVPCIHLLEGITNIRSNPLPIVRLIVSPGRDQGARARALQTLLEQLEIDIPVSLSRSVS